ncbi:hypothetical protein [Telmatospirillum siberiense]|uniref:Uncharacterized protein n=1 Tax=Telmatospirillum siberiense TaxID=382514 RepID=A0A2N3Q1I3_9PROT|nr:hypothetical protein [Telmatospirillum siberiense]PKU26516.1 hypothetical protein CWS72_01335 [Telmatospirillum siberiense]
MAPAGRHPLLWIVLVALLCAQVGYARILRPLRPAIEEMPFPLNEQGIKGLALGDDQFLFRVLARWLQDVGDGGGRVRPLIDYDYDRVVDWLKVLDRLDERSDYSFVLGASYFGSVMEPNAGPSRVRKIALYFRERALADPARRWPELVWAGERARRIVKDRQLSELIAGDLSALRDNPRVPAWLPLLAPPLYRFAGNNRAAEDIDADPGLSKLRREAMQELLKRLNLPESP